MEFLQLRYFRDAAETQNFSKTAQKFGVPTSAVSQSIRRLERELGTTLFERTANRISLNEDGKLLYRAVYQMDKTLEDIKRQFSDQKEELGGEVRMEISCNRQIVSDAIRQFGQMYPKVSFVLSHGAPADGEFDLIISDDELLKDRLSRVALITEPVAIAFSKSHPMASCEEIALKDLATERFVTMQPGRRLYYLTQSLCAQAGFLPKISIQCDDPFYIRQYIEMDLGIGFVPMFSWRGQLPEGLVCKTLEGITRTTYAYWDPSRYMTKATRQFLELLRQLCNKG